jgi:hypothetical protein
MVPVGGHNVLEPVQRGVPVLVGPYHQNFSAEVETLARGGAAHICSSSEEMASALKIISTSGISPDHVRGCLNGEGIDILRQFMRMMYLSGVPGFEGEEKP